MNISGKRSDLPFSGKSDLKREKSVVSFTHEQYSQIQLDDITHEQTFMSRQLFACSTRDGLLANVKEEKFAWK